MYKKENLLFVILGGFFITNALIAEFIGVKIFALEETLGMEPFNWNLFGERGSLNLTAGVLLWPIVFIMTDIINEYYGKRGVRLLSYMAAGLITYGFIMVFGAIRLSPAGFWVGDYTERGVDDMQLAFAAVYGQSIWIIFGSLVAFLVGQLTDVTVFQWLRRFTGNQKLWLRATGSTLVSQFIDSFVVLYIAFVIGQGWSYQLFLAVGFVNYAYKFLIAVLLTPTLYLLHGIIDRYLGKERAEKLVQQASEFT